MKKYHIIILLLSLCVCSTVLLVGCDTIANSTNNQDSVTPQITVNDDIINTSSPTQIFSLFTHLDNCVIEDNKIIITVPQNTNSLSLINAFSIPNNYKWELHLDKTCLPNLNIVSKTADLKYGSNVFYALFINKNDTEEIYLYEIHVYRDCPSAVGTYIRSGHTLKIYDNGMLYLSYSGAYMDLEGTWTQTEDTICYNVWNIDGFEWNNPFYGTIYEDGIDFLGEYYQRKN